MMIQLSGPSTFHDRTLSHLAVVAGKLKQLMSVEPQKPSSNPVDNRRTQRALLRIPIVARAQFAGDAPISEETHTLVVNAHGALIALAMKVRPGQKLMLKNWTTANEQECRVVHVREMPMGKNEVGIAFPYPMPKFWNVEFPPPDWTPFLK